MSLFPVIETVTMAVLLFYSGKLFSPFRRTHCKGRRGYRSHIARLGLSECLKMFV